MLIVLVGKTCSGKTTIRNELNKLGFRSIVTWTTRPIRDGEIQNKTYHYVSDEEFDELLEDQFFVETKTYNTAHGVWRYGSSVEDWDRKEDAVIILSPEGYLDFVEYGLKFGEGIIEHFSIYIYSNNKTIKERLLSRGDNKEEAERRIAQDNKDFEGFGKYADRIVYNNSEDNIKDVVDRIIKFIGRD